MSNNLDFFSVWETMRKNCTHSRSTCLWYNISEPAEGLKIGGGGGRYFFKLLQLSQINFDKMSIMDRQKDHQKILVIKTNTCDDITKILRFSILIHVLSWKQKKTQVSGLITEIFWCNNWQSIIDVIERLLMFFDGTGFFLQNQTNYRGGGDDSFAIPPPLPQFHGLFMHCIFCQFLSTCIGK